MLRKDKPSVAEQLAVSAGPEKANGPAARVGMEYPTAYEPGGQPNQPR